MYSEKVKELVVSLPNSGDVSDPTHSATVENPVCGDVVSLTIRVGQGVIEECRFRAQGCAAAIASAAALTLICTGLPASQGVRLHPQDIVGFLGGLPRHKLHGAELAVEALRRCLESGDAPVPGG